MPHGDQSLPYRPGDRVEHHGTEYQVASIYQCPWEPDGVDVHVEAVDGSDWEVVCAGSLPEEAVLDRADRPDAAPQFHCLDCEQQFADRETAYHHARQGGESGQHDVLFVWDGPDAEGS